MTERREQPPTLGSLTARIRNLADAKGVASNRLDRTVANTVIGQMLPAGVVKGGTAMKLRVGEAASRFTRDVDAARPADVDIDDYIDDLADRLEDGWGGFTGTVEQLPGPRPDGVPDDYIMVPFRVRLAYQGSQWLSVTFELGHDEIGSTADSQPRLAGEIVDMFAVLGLDEPHPVPLLAAEHQIAQKLHACTSINPATGGNERAHDLVDLQILCDEEDVDLAVACDAGRRLFAARQAQPWPPVVVAHDNWTTLYTEAAEGLGVLDTVDAALEWANDLVGRIVAAGA